MFHAAVMLGANDYIETLYLFQKPSICNTKYDFFLRKKWFSSITQDDEWLLVLNRCCEQFASFNFVFIIRRRVKHSSFVYKQSLHRYILSIEAVKLS